MHRNDDTLFIFKINCNNACSDDLHEIKINKKGQISVTCNKYFDRFLGLMELGGSPRSFGCFSFMQCLKGSHPHAFKPNKPATYQDVLARINKTNANSLKDFKSIFVISKLTKVGLWHKFFNGKILEETERLIEDEFIKLKNANVFNISPPLLVASVKKIAKNILKCVNFELSVKKNTSEAARNEEQNWIFKITAKYPIYQKVNYSHALRVTIKSFKKKNEITNEIDLLVEKPYFDCRSQHQRYAINLIAKQKENTAGLYYINISAFVTLCLYFLLPNKLTQNKIAYLKELCDQIQGVEGLSEEEKVAFLEETKKDLNNWNYIDDDSMFKHVKIKNSSQTSCSKEQKLESAILNAESIRAINFFVRKLNKNAFANFYNLPKKFVAPKVGRLCENQILKIDLPANNLSPKGGYAHKLKDIDLNVVAEIDNLNLSIIKFYIKFLNGQYSVNYFKNRVLVYQKILKIYKAIFYCLGGPEALKIINALVSESLENCRLFNQQNSCPIKNRNI